MLGIDIAAIVAQATEMSAQAKEMAKRALDQVALDEDAMEAVMPSAAFMAREFGNPREIVKNAPYTADAVTEFVQTLPDGNQNIVYTNYMGQVLLREHVTGEGSSIEYYQYDDSSRLILR